jgi:hypothetical protein
MIRNLVWLGIAGLIGAVSVYAFSPSPVPIYRNVIVPVERIVEREPDTVRTFVDRIVTVQAEPIQIARAPGGAQDQVQSFCEPIIIARTDTVEVGEPLVDPMLLLRSVSYDRRWGPRRDRLFLTGPMNTGDLVGIDYEVRGDWTVRAVGPDALVQYPRTSFIYDYWEAGSQIFTGYKIIEALAGLIK